MNTTTTFFGFGIAPSMFPASCNIRKETITAEKAKDIIGAGVTSCLNPSHQATIGVMRTRYGMDVEIPAKAPVVQLQVGDRLVVLAVAGLPRLEGRHEYSTEEIANAKFSFALFTVTE